MNANRSELTYDLDLQGQIYRLTWLGRADVLVSRVRALAFTEEGFLVLVRGSDGLQLPGGGLENGEGSLDALTRELWEEVAASILDLHRLGAFRIVGITNDLQEAHDFYWCRVRLADDWMRSDDISERVLVTEDEFLDTLPWGRTDPKAQFLLERALEVQRSRLEDRLGPSQ